MAQADIGLVNANQQQTNGATPCQKTLPEGPLSGPNVRQGEFSSSELLNVTASKTDVLRPDKDEASSLDNSKSSKGAKTELFWQTSRVSKAKTKNDSTPY